MSLQKDLQESLNRVDEAVHKERDTNDPERAIRLIQLGYTLNEAKKFITSLQKEATALLLDSDWDRNPVQEEKFSLETKTGAPRKQWDHERLVSLVAQRIADTAIDMDTGEVTKSPQDMIAELMKYAAPSYWRVSALRDLGIDADDYCDVGEANTNLIYRSNDV
tara:strand:- start:6179 stop:6670 length:492 start_codon:yes stop_codon:yes gene_type:complete